MNANKISLAVLSSSKCFSYKFFILFLVAVALAFWGGGIGMSILIIYLTFFWKSMPKIYIYIYIVLLNSLIFFFLAGSLILWLAKIKIKIEPYLPHQCNKTNLEVSLKIWQW